MFSVDSVSVNLQTGLGCLEKAADFGQTGGTGE